MANGALRLLLVVGTDASGLGLPVPPFQLAQQRPIRANWLLSTPAQMDYSRRAVAALAAATALGFACSCAPLAASPAATAADQQHDAPLTGVRCGEDDEGRPRTLSAPELGRMRDSTELLRGGDFAALRTRLREDGYLLLRGLLSRAAVAKARAACIKFLVDQALLRPGTPQDDAAVQPGGSGVLLAKYQDSLVALPEIRSVLESPQPFFNSLFDQPSDSFP